MKNTLLIIIIVAIIAIGYYFNQLIDSKKSAIADYVSKNLNSQNDLKVKIDSLKVLKSITDSLDNKINSLKKEKNDVITAYQNQSKWVEKMNKQYMETIDMNGNGTPDNIERGDYNNDGRPDY